jgi:hypothetical protein
MSKTIKSMIFDAEIKWAMWLEISEDERALKDRCKSKKEAIELANYFEGRFDALIDARNELKL